jgi:hypothetical protein
MRHKMLVSFTSRCRVRHFDFMVESVCAAPELAAPIWFLESPRAIEPNQRGVVEINHEGDAGAVMGDCPGFNSNKISPLNRNRGSVELAAVSIFVDATNITRS